jgi:hypothetical protein
MSRLWKAFAYSSVVLLWVLSYPVAAQVTTGTILGTVRDASGAPISNTTVTITQEETGYARSVLSGCNIFVAVSCWALPNDLSGHFSGSLSGMLNMANNLGGALSPVLTPLLAREFGWTVALDVAAVVILSMGSLWFLVHPERSLDPI